MFPSTLLLTVLFLPTSYSWSWFPFYQQTYVLKDLTYLRSCVIYTSAGYQINDCFVSEDDLCRNKIQSNPLYPLIVQPNELKPEIESTTINQETSTFDFKETTTNKEVTTTNKDVTTTNKEETTTNKEIITTNNVLETTTSQITTFESTTNLITTTNFEVISSTGSEPTTTEILTTTLKDIESKPPPS
ncbi:uncharacterized protein [Onthophagus taurus]|uniref:uncharacterized protein n=1 Tax=Onthophagus taurus TaxID=166361 RepID=UPI0039BE3628